MIEAQGLTKSYGEVRALRGASFTIGANEIVGLLGPNGAGKTTLMKLLTGYLQPDEGSATVAEIDVLRDPLGAQSLIGYLPENAPLYGDMAVQEYLLLIADLREIPPEDVKRLVSDAVYSTGLDKYLTRPIGTLSKGLRQRVGLAQAILHRPRVLILDEPTSGLDPNQIVEIRSLIKKLSRQTTVLLSTHILSEVEVTCERVLIIIDGEVRTDARLAELRAGNAALVSIQSGPANVEGALRMLPSVSDVRLRGTQDGFATYYVTGSNKDLCPTIYDLARAQNWRLAELRPDHQTLESIFRNMGAE